MPAEPQQLNCRCSPAPCTEVGAGRPSRGAAPVPAGEKSTSLLAGVWGRAVGGLGQLPISQAGSCRVLAGQRGVQQPKHQQQFRAQLRTLSFSHTYRKSRKRQGILLGVLLIEILEATRATAGPCDSFCRSDIPNAEHASIHAWAR